MRPMLANGSRFAGDLVDEMEADVAARPGTGDDGRQRRKARAASSVADSGRLCRPPSSG